MKHEKSVIFVAGLSLTLVLAGCSVDDEGEDDDTTHTGENGQADPEEEASGSMDYAEEMDYEIVGIDPGAGIMGNAEQMMEDYDLDEWNLQSSSEAAMISSLEEAIENEEPIVVTGWSPHWKFISHDLKYLDDPELSFGEAEDIHTLVREGFQDDFPEAYEILDNFHWTAGDMEEIMYELNEGVDEFEAAQNWIDENEDVVSSWTEGVDEVDGDPIEIVHGQWETDLSSVSMIALVLEDMGYDVDMTLVEANHMYTAIANGDADAMIGSWLPGTHELYYEQVEDDIEDLGPNMEGEAALGLVVPEYMDIDSIEDLKDEG